MVYKVIGLMSGSSLDGLDIAYVHLSAVHLSASTKGISSAPGTSSVLGTSSAPGTSSTPGTSPVSQGSSTNSRAWEFQLMHTACHPYSAEWRDRLAGAAGLSAFDYQLLHVEYGHYLGREVSRFIAAHGLEYQVQLIASHGHTALHCPARRMTAQLGDGAAIAAETRINVVSDLRAMDVALGGQGAPIVPIGEGMLWGEYALLLNLGGIANVSRPPFAFDVAPANRVLNALAGDAGLAYDKDGMMAAAGRVDEGLLERLNALPYYGMGYPKSLANEFGLNEVLPLVRGAGLSVADALRTYVEHLVVQIGRAVEVPGFSPSSSAPAMQMLVTGGGAHNSFLVGRLRARLAELGVEIVVPGAAIVDYKEALVMALIGVLRWREENNVLASVTGASRDSIGGAVWIGQEI